MLRSDKNCTQRLYFKHQILHAVEVTHRFSMSTDFKHEILHAVEFLHIFRTTYC